MDPYAPTIEPTPRTTLELDDHLRTMHATLVYRMADYEPEHDEQHRRAEAGTLGDHAEFWAPHTHRPFLDGNDEGDLVAYRAAVIEAIEHVDKLDTSGFYVQSFVVAVSGEPVSRDRWDDGQYVETTLTEQDGR